MPLNVLGLVPARGGSKGVPGKNQRLLAGRTLLDYAAQAGRDSGVIDRLVLSTDSQEIAQLGACAGIEVPFLRSPMLALDTTPMVDVVTDAVLRLAGEGWHPDMIVLLQPTSPLRRPRAVRAAVEMLIDRADDYDSVVSVVAVPQHLSPDYVMHIEREVLLMPFLSDRPPITRRQDARQAYFRDGTVYAFWARNLVSRDIYGAHCAPLILDERDSLTIDTEADWAEAERRILNVDHQYSY